MKITKIEVQKKRKNRYNIYIDDKFAFGVDEDVLINCSLSKGMKLTDDFIETVIKAEEYNKAYNYSLNLLSYRARSEKEVRDKLNQKGYEEDIINRTIELLYKDKYLNDYEFGKSLIKDKQTFNKAGKNLLKQELFKKGIDKEIINELLKENVNEEDEYERALEVARKKFKTFNEKDDKGSRYRKLSGLMGRKGYSFDIISRVIKEILNEYLNEDEF